MYSRETPDLFLFCMSSRRKKRISLLMNSSQKREKTRGNNTGVHDGKCFFFLVWSQWRVWRDENLHPGPHPAAAETLFICTDTHVRWANTGTHTHTDHWTAEALACCVCWHVFKVHVTVCVCVCVPAPVCASLPFPCHSPPWQGAGRALGTAASIVDKSWQPAQACPRYVALAVICSLYG